VDFFKNMSLARIVILVCLLAAIPLGYLGVQASGRMAELDASLQDTEKVVRSIQMGSIRLSQLQEQAQGEGIRGQDNVASYIRLIAQSDKVKVGQVDIKPKSKTTGEAIEESYAIEPFDADRRFDRTRITNFLFKLEEDSRKVKLTSIEITPFDKKVRPHDELADSWRFKATLATRRKK
jgi:hypothetical protein